MVLSMRRTPVERRGSRGHHPSVPSATARSLERDIRAWLTDWNEHPRPFVRAKTGDEILDAVAAYCRPSDSHH